MNGSFINCCDDKRTGSTAAIVAVNCAGIHVESNDPSWPDRKCLTLVRSQSAPAIDCTPGPTQQEILQFLGLQFKQDMMFTF